MADYEQVEDLSGSFFVEESPMGYRRVQQLEVYQSAMALGEQVWNIVSHWDFLPKDTIGKQWVRAADSIAANLSEGYGRYSFKENLRFCYFSRGSHSEACTWLEKARNRNLVSDSEAKKLSQDLEDLRGLLNGYIKYVRRKSLEV